MKERIIPFLKYRYIAYAASLSLFVLFIVLSIPRGGLMLGVDFVGGLKIIAKFEKGVEEGAIRQALKAYNPLVQQIGEAESNEFIISTKLSGESVFAVEDRITGGIEKNFPKVKIEGDPMLIVSFEGGVNEGAFRARLAPMDAVAQKIDDAGAGASAYIVHGRYTGDYKSNYSAEEVETALRGAYPDLRVLTGVALVAYFPPGVDEKSLGDILKQYGTRAVRSEHSEKPAYLVYRLVVDEAERITAILAGQFKKVEVLSVENVGPAIGSFLRKSAIKLFSVAIILMMIYLAYRFEIRYAMGAMAALVHDVILAVAFCGAAGVEINIPVVAAILTIFGYSINDTIVIFDRVRENTNVETRMSFREIIDRSITQSLSRTLLTSLTTIFSVLALYLIGGEGLNDFALVLLFGLVVGTYSSTYVASPVLLSWENFVTRVRSLRRGTSAS
ncbi:MAG: protein translocase subunit SecF [Spirochaetes bacterium]|nr:protein translocase subunit SecF [Spirochaetota bacterium]